MQHLAPPKSTPGFDRQRLLAVIEPIARAHGAEVVDVELKNENGWILRLYVEKLGATNERMSTKDAAVDLDLCAGIARDLSPALDVADPITARYHLEVSSPGLERPLRKETDYVRFAGHKAKLKLGNGVAGQKVLVGILGNVADGVVTVQDENAAKTYPVPLEDVVAARLVFEFGPASKPPSSQRRGKSKTKKRKQ